MATCTSSRTVSSHAPDSRLATSGGHLHRPPVLIRGRTATSHRYLTADAASHRGNSHAIRHRAWRRFPDYELSDHTAKRRKLSDLQGQHPMILVLSRGGFCAKDAGRRKDLCNSIANSKSATADWSRSVPTTSPRPTNTAPEWAPTGRSCPTLDASAEGSGHCGVHRCRAQPDDPHVIVLELGLVIYKIYNGYWFFSPPTLEELARTCARLRAGAGPTGTPPRPSSRRRGWMAARSCLIRMARPTPRPSVDRISWSPRASATHSAPSRTRTDTVRILSPATPIRRCSWVSSFRCAAT